MIRPKDQARAQLIRDGLNAFESQSGRVLQGIVHTAQREALVFQLIESLHRIAYPQTMLLRPLGPAFADPADPLFNPLLAAILSLRAGDVEEASWLVFLFVHFGKHRRGGWRYAREVYGRLGQGGLWDWSRTRQSPHLFRDWLDTNRQHLARPGSGFGNHRKRESLDARSPRGTGAAVQTYVEWIGAAGSHAELIADVLASAQQDERRAFDLLYHQMDAVASFGRTARFDYCTMLGKLGIAAIVPGVAYLNGATGPLSGVRLLLNDDSNSPTPWDTCERVLVEIDQHISVGMQALEDALCNWQKSPTSFRAFRG